MVAMQKLAGKVAVVTGASKGIGAAIAKRLADKGESVVVNYASSKEAADRVVAAIAAKGGKAVAVQANMADKADIHACSPRRSGRSGGSTCWSTTPAFTSSPRWRK